MDKIVLPKLGNMLCRTYSKNDALKRFASLKLQYRTMLCWKATPFKFAPRDEKSRENESTKHQSIQCQRVVEMLSFEAEVLVISE